MTRSEYSRTLSYMEHIRLASYEAETAAERKRLQKQYRLFERHIEPFVMGTEQFDPEPTQQPQTSEER